MKLTTGRTAKRRQQEIDRRIDHAFRTRCNGIPVPMLSISKIFDHGRQLIAQGADDAALADGIAAFVETIRS